MRIASLNLEFSLRTILLVKPCPAGALGRLLAGITEFNVEFLSKYFILVLLRKNTNMHFPNKQLDTTKISSIFYRLGRKEPQGITKISELIADFHENGLLLTMLFFALPVAVPLPYPPGFTTIMGVPLIILAIQMLLGYRQIFLPTKISNYQIRNATLITISKKIVPIIARIEKYIKPRCEFANSVYCEQFVGLISLLCSIAVAVPLPLTNAIPACGIAIMMLGLLNRDGITIILGGLTSIIGISVGLIVIAASWLSIKYLFHLFF